MTLKAVGTVNYECRPITGMAGAYAWTLAAQDAALKHWSGFRVGRLYQGPTWVHRDGSKLTGRLRGSAAGEPGRLPDQLWRVRGSGKQGELSDVVFVRRIHAKGEPPPAEPCTRTRVGALGRSAYEANYEFYSARY